jgi:hypothetical protein
MRDDFAVQFKSFAELKVIAMLRRAADYRAHDLKVNCSSLDNMVGFGACASQMVDVVDAP